jgi:hypothetical protein
MTAPSIRAGFAAAYRGTRVRQLEMSWIANTSKNCFTSGQGKDLWSLKNNFGKCLKQEELLRVSQQGYLLKNREDVRRRWFACWSRGRINKGNSHVGGKRRRQRWSWYVGGREMCKAVEFAIFKYIKKFDTANFPYPHVIQSRFIQIFFCGPLCSIAIRPTVVLIVSVFLLQAVLIFFIRRNLI